MDDCNFEGKRVFLSGPMTGMEDWNRAAFAEAEREMREGGASDVRNPARLAPREGEPVLSHEGYMRRCLRALTISDWVLDDKGSVPYYDALALLPGWERSEGARVERAVAEAIGVEVVEL